MNIDALKAQITEAEGLRLRPYMDTLGHWTVGVGHLLPADLTRDQINSMALTRDEADALLHRDLTVAIHGAESFAWFHTLNDARQAVIVEMVFQLGVAGVAQFVRMAAGIKARDFHLASRSMLESKWATQTPTRVKRLAKAMRDG